MYRPTSYLSWQPPPLPQFDQVADVSPFVPPSDPIVSHFHQSPVNHPPSSPVASQNTPAFYSSSPVHHPASSCVVQQASNGPPQCIQIKPNQTGKTQYFPSAHINTAVLFKSDTILQKYPGLHGKSKAGTLAVKLAREAFFCRRGVSTVHSQWLQTAPSLTT